MQAPESCIMYHDPSKQRRLATKSVVCHQRRWTGQTGSLAGRVALPWQWHMVARRAKIQPREAAAIMLLHVAEADSSA